MSEPVFRPAQPAPPAPELEAEPRTPRLDPLRPALAIVPVKRLDIAKSRLTGALDAADRRALMLAMLADVLMNLRRSRGIGRIVVVTDDREVRHRAIAEGAEVVADQDAGSHSAAALRGIAAAASPQDRVLLAPGDCPLMRVEDLDELLSTPQPAVVVVPDRHGHGTNALLLDPPDAIDPSFGEGSCERHLELARAAGVDAAARVVPSLALDIDTPDDLAMLRAQFRSQRGGAPATRGVIASRIG
ncbi:MAG: 2-phospho-L-lactate guanylyltransferase [Solirubrobacteraceae bacterium]|nr:2-phospho-L-lactate guanylyltransferase [Solirubrobacteraceae bacterium]